MEVLELTNNPQVDTQALKQCLEKDPALTARILQVVNSSLFGLSRKVGDLGQALALLGTVPLKLLVLSFSLPDELFRNLGADFLAHYWQSSLCQAVAARSFHQRGWGQSGDEAFVAGLLRQLGQLVLAQMLGQPYLQLWYQARDQKTDLCTQERAYLGLDHVELTVRLLDQWQLPQLLIDALSQEEPVLGDSEYLHSLRGAVRLGVLTCELLVEQRDGAWPNLLQQAQELAALGEPEVRRILYQVREGVQCVAEALQLEQLGTLDVDQILSRAQTQLAQVAQEAAATLANQGDKGPLPLALSVQQELRRALHEAVQGTKATRLAPTVAQPPAEPASSTESPSPSDPQCWCEGASDPRLLELVRNCAWECRSRRMPLSVMLVAVSGLEQLQQQLPLVRWRMVRDLIHASCKRVDWWPKRHLVVREALVALVLLDCDRCQAVELGYQLMHVLREVSSRTAGPAARNLHVHVGIATVEVPPPNFDPQQLLDAAQRCLWGAVATGTDHLKSIEAL